VTTVQLSHLSAFFLNSVQPFNSGCYITTAIKAYPLIAVVA
jgi:hypothetical protein